MSVTVYVSTCTSSMETKKHQQMIQQVLDGKKIEYTVVDVATDREALNKMREISGNQKALAPQICNGDQYCGAYDEFENAVENSCVEEFLKL